MKRLICVLPCHKEVLSANESVSYHRLVSVVRNHDIVIIFPRGKELPIEFKHDSVNVIFLNDFWFESLENYNKLKISTYFYNLFKDYDFLLTYELDSYIFENRIDYFMDLNFDYVGAPWVDFLNTNGEKKIVFCGVGNSGFSLRKIKSCIFVLNNWDLDCYLKKYIDNNFYFFGFKRSMPNFFLIKKWLYKLCHLGNLDYYSACFSINEDLFWSYMFAKQGFKVASLEESMQFSFECHPKELFEINNNSLPMGCHAWEKWDLEFWRKHIHEIQ